MLWLFFASVIYFAILLALSQQPPGAHPDSFTKALQVLTGDRNYFHPQLLLVHLEFAHIFQSAVGLGGSGALGTIEINGATVDRLELASLILIGRYICCFYAALAVLLASLVGLRLFGAAGGALWFAVFAMNSAILVTGRYLKEDVLLLFAIVLLGLLLTLRADTSKRQQYSALLAGSAVALTMSSKYVGAAFALVFVAIYFATSEHRQRRSTLLFLGSFIVVLLVVNLHFVADFARGITGLEKELRHASSGHRGVVTGARSTLYFDMIRQTVPLICLIVVPLYLLVARTGERHRPILAVFLFATASLIVYGLAIQLSPSKIPRYAFPLLVLAPMVVLTAACATVTNSRAKVLKGIAAVSLAVLLYQSAVNTVTIVQAIRNDSRDELARYVSKEKELHNARIMADHHTLLHVSPKFFVLNKKNNRVKLEGSYAGAIDCLDKNCDHIDYFATSCTVFSRFFRDDARLNRKDARRKEFYENLLSEEPLARFGPKENLEEAFGLYESPCLYVIPNRRISG